MNQEYGDTLAVIFVILLIAVFVVLLVVAILKIPSEIKRWLRAEKEKLKNLCDRLNSIEGFKVSRIFVSPDRTTGIAFDEVSKRICLLENPSSSREINEFKPYIFTYKDILSSELIQDGETVNKATKSNLDLGGAVLGGLMFGGAGAIIGGLSGKPESRLIEKVTAVTLKVVVMDTTKPVHRIEFLWSTEKKGSRSHKEAVESAEHWHGLLAVLIKMAEANK